MPTKSRTRNTTPTAAQLLQATDLVDKMVAELKKATVETVSAFSEAQAMQAELRAALAKSTAPTGTQTAPKVSKGHVVLFRAPGPQGSMKELAATVAAVVDEASGRANLAVYGEDALSFPRHDVPYSETPKANTWGWPTRS